MKKLSKILILVMLFSLAACCFSACGKTYTVTWMNGSEILEVDEQVKPEDELSFDGEVPTKERTAEFTYSFSGWSLTPDGDVIEISEIDLTKGEYESEIKLYAQFTSTKNKYTVTWNNWNGRNLKTERNVLYGMTPTAPSTTPIREADAQYTYVFSGWDKEITPVTGDVTYTAQFTSILNKYTVIWKNWDDSILETDLEVEYGTMPEYNGSDPLHVRSAQYTYTFSGWSPEVGEVEGDTVYVAQFNTTVNKYTVTWLNSDESELLVQTDIPYGTVPEYNGATPTRTATAQYSFEFDGWNGDTAVGIVGDTTFIAKYRNVTNKYTVTWKNYNGDILETDVEVPYGTTPTYDGATPTREKDAQYTYTFSGFTPTVEAVKGNVEYTATFSNVTNTYTVTWKNYDGGILETDNGVAYGTKPHYDGATPVKESTAEHAYTWTGWDNDVNASVTGNVTFIAQFSESTRSYLIKFMQEGSELYRETVLYGVLPEYKGESPVKHATAEFTYTFNGWDPLIAEVTGEATYEAVFTSTKNKYLIKFLNENGDELSSGLVEYGVLPEYTGTPTKESSAKFDYTFDGWDKAIVPVTGEATYTATYSSNVRSYLIEFKDWDGSTLQSGLVLYGVLPEYEGTPERVADAEFTYTWTGWDSEIVEVVGAATYTATYSSVTNKYDAVFVNYDSSILQSESLDYGSIAEYKGETPVRATDDDFIYTFEGWSPNPATTVIDDNKTFVAQFRSVPVTYHTVTWENYDGSVLETDTLVRYDTMPSYDGAEPTKPTDFEHSYLFDKWTPTVSLVKGDVTYTATFIEGQLSAHTVTYKNGDQTIETDTDVTYGTFASYDGETPTKEQTAEFTFDFIGFAYEGTTEVLDLSKTRILGDTVFVAIFGSTTRSYLITFLDEDESTVLQETAVLYGETPEYAGTPTKAQTDEFTYTFDGWSPEVVAVEGEATYVATYTGTKRSYLITFVDYNDEELTSSSFEYGTTPIYDGTPTRTSTDEFDYTFDGWTPEIVSVTGRATYKATYTETKRKYLITFVNYDKTELSKSEVEYGETPVYDGTPARTSTEQYEYTFSGWTPEIVTVTGTATYKATYTQSTRKYTVTWKNYNDGILETDLDVEYGTMPEYNSPTPNKESDETYNYTFIGWLPEVVTVSGDATYVAQFNSVERSSYTVTFKNGTDVLDEIQVKEGDNPVYSGETPTRQTAQYNYLFNGWSRSEGGNKVDLASDAEKVVANIIYYAIFETRTRTYTVKYVNGEETLLEKSEIAYGTVIDKAFYTKAAPTKAPVGTNSFVFDGWTVGEDLSVIDFSVDGTTVTVEGDIIFNAHFKKIGDNVAFSDGDFIVSNVKTGVSTESLAWTDVAATYGTAITAAGLTSDYFPKNFVKITTAVATTKFGIDPSSIATMKNNAQEGGYSKLVIYIITTDAKGYKVGYNETFKAGFTFDDKNGVCKWALKATSNIDKSLTTSAAGFYKIELNVSDVYALGFNLNGAAETDTYIRIEFAK